MSKSSPQTNYFKMAEFTNKIKQILFWTIFFSSIVFTFINIYSVKEGLSVISLVMLLILELLSNNFREKAEEYRRQDFIDNSLGTKFSHNPSNEYYDNDEIKQGFYKVAVNLFENTFYSLEIINKMKGKEIFNNIVFFTIVVVLAIYGFSKNAIALPILQLFLSQKFILKLLGIFRYSEKIEEIFKELKLFFESGFNQDDIKSQAKIMKLLVDHESNISNFKIEMNSKIYTKIDSDLKTDWNNIKKLYDIH